MFTIFKVGDEEYKLKLTVQNVVALEKALGCNPVAIFGDGDTIPNLTILAHVIFYSMQKYNHGISLTDTYNIIDKWFEEGHTQTELFPIVIDIYRNSGLLPKDNSGIEKN